MTILRPVDPLAVAAPTKEVREPTKERQFAKALADPENKAAWLDVIANYGNEPLEGGWARIHLGRLYLADGRYDDARRLFNEVVRFNNEESLKQQGYLGLAAVALQQGDRSEAIRLIDSFVPDREAIAGTAMGEWYFRIMEAGRDQASTSD